MNLKKLLFPKFINLQSKLFCDKLHTLRKLMKLKKFDCYLIFRSDKHDVIIFYIE